MVCWASPDNAPATPGTEDGWDDGDASEQTSHSHGGTLIDSTAHIPEQLATKGVMGSVQPGRRQQADIDFGWPLLEQVVELAAGGAIAVRERDIIAVEACVSGAPASHPTFGSERQKALSQSVARWGSHLLFCSSEPKSMMALQPMDW